MTDERVKQLMADVGHPNSRGIMQLILQVENETAQYWQKKTALECVEVAAPKGSQFCVYCGEMLDAIRAKFNLKNDGYDAKAHEAMYP